MKKRKKQRGVGALIALLAIVLAAVIAVIVWKQWEYRASADFYGGLRGAVESRGLWL